jgi:hypothetical protein
MVTFYGAGERTGIMNVETQLAKILGKRNNTLVVKASDRDAILGEISARIARYEKFDPETAEALKDLRVQVKESLNKGIHPGQELMEELYFLDNESKAIIDKISMTYDMVVTPEDFKNIAKIMSKHLGNEVPILKNFTKFHGRLAGEFLAHAKPANASFDWKQIAEEKILGTSRTKFFLPKKISEFLGLPSDESVSEQIFKRFSFYKPGTPFYKIINGVASAKHRRTGSKYLNLSIKEPSIDFKKGTLGKERTLFEIKLFNANKLPKSWTNVPNVNFDGKIIEQNFTQTIEEKLYYKDKYGNWIVNIINVPQKTSASWWDELINKSGKINDIADINKARTAFGVNANHSNDATLVKRFHLWGMKNNITTSTVHDAFFTNIADMIEARKALRLIYANTLSKNVIKDTLDEMLKRGLPRNIYDQYLNEAIEIGLIPVIGRSRVGERLMTEEDLLKIEDLTSDIKFDFSVDKGWYGVG